MPDFLKHMYLKVKRKRESSEVNFVFSSCNMKTLIQPEVKTSIYSMIHVSLYV